MANFKKASVEPRTRGAACQSAAMRPITLAYTLRNSQRGTLTCLAGSTTAAILVALDTFGMQLRTASARAGVCTLARNPGQQP